MSLPPPVQALTALARLDISRHGVVPNSAADQTAVIQAALNMAAANGQSAFFPGGVYLYSGTVTVPCPIEGEGIWQTELRCTTSDGSTSLWDVSGLTKFFARNLFWDSPNATAAVNNESAGHLRLTNCNQYEIDGCLFAGSASASVLQRSCTNGRVFNNTTLNVWHDSYHHTKACDNITTSHNSVINGGDDAFAVVGYLSDGVRPKHITIANNQVSGTKYARGVAIVGGEEIIVIGNSINRSYLAGIYVSAETGYNTYNVDNCEVASNVLDGCGNINAPGLGGLVSAMPALYLVAGTGKSVNQINVHDNVVVNSANTGIYTGSLGGNVNNCRIANNFVHDVTDVYNKNGITLSTSGSTASGSVLPFAYTTNVGYGMAVTGTNIPAGTTVIAATATSVTLSNPISGTVGSAAAIVFWNIGFVSVNLFTSASTASGTSLLFAAVTGTSIGMSVSGTNVSAGTLVAGFTATTITLSQAIGGTVASGATITFGNPMDVKTVLATSGDTPSGSAFTFASTSGVTGGMVATGLNVPASTTVLSATSTTVTLSHAVSGDVPNGTSISFFGSTASNLSCIELHGSLHSTIDGNTLSRSATRGIFVANSNNGTITLRNNMGIDLNVSKGIVGRMIEVQSGMAGGALLEIDDNYMRLPAGWVQPFDAFILNPNWALTVWGSGNRCQGNAIAISASLVPAGQTVGSSPWTFTNGNYSDVSMAVVGGTVSDISIKRAGQTGYSTAQTAGLFDLSWNDSIVVTYSAVPTVTMIQRLRH